MKKVILFSQLAIILSLFVIANINDVTVANAIAGAMTIVALYVFFVLEKLNK
jgi:uncharacterized MnhB-related membrane protein